MYYARISETPHPPYAACILNQWPLTLKILANGQGYLTKKIGDTLNQSEPTLNTRHSTEKNVLKQTPGALHLE